MKKHIIKLDWLKDNSACQSGINIFVAEFGNNSGLKRIIKYCINNCNSNLELFNHANWLLTKYMKNTQRI